MPIALVDLDGTIADFDTVLAREMFKISFPGEPIYDGVRDVPDHIEARRKLIKQIPGFWENLPRLELGFDVVDYLREMGFQLNILTKCSKNNSLAWAEKINWCSKNIPDASCVITSESKSLVYGKILVDDWPEYFLPWLEVRPRGLVIAVAHPWNASIQHPQVIRYDGSNLDAVKRSIDSIKASAPVSRTSGRL